MSAGILDANGDLNVFVATAVSQGGTYTHVFVFSVQYTRREVEAEAVSLFNALHPTEGDPDVRIMEHEVLAK